jgi:hypothetical protein
MCISSAASHGAGVWLWAVASRRRRRRGVVVVERPATVCTSASALHAVRHCRVRQP